MSARARALAGVAVVVAGALAGGAAYALDQATTDGSPKALASPTASPTPSETPSESPTPSPTPAATASPTPAPAATATAAPTRSPAPRPPAKHYPYPSPTRSYAGLTLQAQVDPQRGTTNQTFTLTGTAHDGDGTIFLSSIDWGDGTVDHGEKDPSGCPAYPSPTSDPGPYQPHPDDRSGADAIKRTHRYSETGTYTVTITVRSTNADCRPHGPRTETATATFTGATGIYVV